MAEENETPGGGESGTGPYEGRGRRSEGDLLAERRARRAAESGEHALTRRAEAAEATVRTLETHVASLQQRLREADQERRRIAELIEAEQTPVAPDVRFQTPPPSPPSEPGAVERELRRVKQREYAEQRLRAEAEERCRDLERESRAEIDQLTRRLNASERDAGTLAARLEGLQRELAEAEQAAAAERAAERRAERVLQARLGELESRAVEIQRELDAERAARDRSERLLASMRRGHRRVEGLVAELRAMVARLKSAGAEPVPLQRAPEEPEPRPEAPKLAVPSAAVEVQHAQMADALAAAVERLRARAQAHPEHPLAPASMAAAHKHSMSLIRRWRIARKQRRER